MNKEKSLTFLQSCIEKVKKATEQDLSLIHISEPTRH